MNDSGDTICEVDSVEGMDAENPDEPERKVPKMDSKVVVKFQPGRWKLLEKQTEAKVMAESEKYFVNQIVMLEEKKNEPTDATWSTKAWVWKGYQRS